MKSEERKIYVLREERKVKSEKGKVKNPYVKGTFYSFAKKNGLEKCLYLKRQAFFEAVIVLGRYGA